MHDFIFFQSLITYFTKLFRCSNGQDLVVDPSSQLLHPCDISLSCVWVFLFFLEQQKLFLYHLLPTCSNPGINHLSERPQQFLLRMILEIKIWLLGMLIATVMTLLLGSFGRQSQEIHVCLAIYTCTSIQINMQTYTYTHIHIHMHCDSQTSRWCQQSLPLGIYTLVKGFVRGLV